MIRWIANRQGQADVRIEVSSRIQCHLLRLSHFLFPSADRQKVCMLNLKLVQLLYFTCLLLEVERKKLVIGMNLSLQGKSLSVVTSCPNEWLALGTINTTNDRYYDMG